MNINLNHRETAFNLLRNNFLFNSVSDHVIHSLLKNFKIDYLNKGDLIIDVDKTLYKFYCIAKGKIKVFNNDFDTYQVIFKNIEGQIVATYDANGKLIHAFEKFKITQLPESVSNVIKTEYPGLTIQSTVYRVNYYNRAKKSNPVFKKVYNIQIVNENKKLNIKVSPQGKILNKKKIIN